jgi:uncharacterized protein (TIGR03435 family)
MRYRVLPIILLIGGDALAQTPAAKPQFEVATIKPAAPLNPAAIASGKLRVGMNIDAARVDIGFLSLADMIQAAFKVKQHQLVVPDWAKNERFDILAKIPEGGTKEQVPEMLQALLVERFGLKFHKESREQNVFALVVAKGGHKMKESSTEPDAPLPDEKTDKAGQTISMGGAQIRQSGGTVTMKVADQPGTMKMTMVDGKMRMESTKAKMENLAEMVTRFVGKPVVDMTELKGLYDIAIEISMAEMMNIARAQGVAVPAMAPGGAPGGDSRPADAASDPTAGGSIFTSIQALGLKLENRKAPFDTMIVDKLERTPTEN